MADKKRQYSLETMVLKFDKRRYDGGPEVELIRYIEHSQVKTALEAPVRPVMTSEAPMRHMAAQPKCGQKKCGGNCNGKCTCGTACAINKNEGCTSACAQPCKVHGAKASKPSKVCASGRCQPQLTRKQMITEALILGPMEVAVGAVGILTSSLAVFTFFQLKNPAMARQSRQVLGECCATLVKGIVDTALSPFSLVRAVVVGR